MTQLVYQKCQDCGSEIKNKTYTQVIQCPTCGEYYAPCVNCKLQPNFNAEKCNGCELLHQAEKLNTIIENCDLPKDTLDNCAFKLRELKTMKDMLEKWKNATSIIGFSFQNSNTENIAIDKMAGSLFFDEIKELMIDLYEEKVCNVHDDFSRLGVTYATKNVITNNDINKCEIKEI